MRWDEVRKGTRVVDARNPDRAKRAIAGTCEDVCDPLSKIVRVHWDGGGTSQVYVGVLSLAEARAAA